MPSNRLNTRYVFFQCRECCCNCCCLSLSFAAMYCTCFQHCPTRLCAHGILFSVTPLTQVFLLPKSGDWSLVPELDQLRTVVRFLCHQIEYEHYKFSRLYVLFSRSNRHNNYFWYFYSLKEVVRRFQEAGRANLYHETPVRNIILPRCPFCFCSPCLLFSSDEISTYLDVSCRRPPYDRVRITSDAARNHRYLNYRDIKRFTGVRSPIFACVVFCMGIAHPSDEYVGYEDL